MHKPTFSFLVFTALGLLACSSPVTELDPQKPVAGMHHYVDGYEPVTDEGLVQIVVEIPTGTTQKWEVNKVDGKLHWEIKDGKPRIIKYLGYPGNYGMVPRTLLSYENGGDGDPLDVLVLGPPVKRGTVIKTKVIGVLNLSDGGEQDDKLIAVMEDTPFYDVESIEGLKREYPGVLFIIQTWFVSYKGPGKLTSTGFSSVEKAQSILHASIEEYSKQTK